MGKGPKVPETQTVINKTELPPWLDQGGAQLFQQAKQVGAGMADPYQGNLVPGFNDYHKAGFNQATAASGIAVPGLNSAMEAAGRTANFQPGQVQAQNFLQGNIGQYMNPFIDQVETQALGRLNDQRQQALTSVGDQALQVGAGWGSRHGIREAVTDAEFGKAAGDLSAGLRSQGFSQAQGMMQSDMDRALQAGMANQGAGLQGAQINSQGAFMQGQLAEALQKNAMQGAGVLEGIGDKYRELEGAKLAQTAMQHEQMRQAPLERLQVPMQAIGAIPYGGTSSTTGPSNYQKPNPFMGALGGLSAGAGIASSLGMAGMGGGLMTGLGGILGLFSDRDEKTDIKKLGKDPDTGIPLYAYRYKGDPKSYPKVVGPMAQDLEKIPGAITKVGGKRVVRNLGLGR